MSLRLFCVVAVVLGMFPGSAASQQMTSGNTFTAMAFAGLGGPSFITSLLGIGAEYRIASRFHTGPTVTFVQVNEPCADPDIETNPQLCLADGRTLTWGIRSRFHSPQETFKPSLRVAAGGLQYTDRFRPSEWVPTTEIAATIGIGAFAADLRYGRTFDKEFEGTFGKRNEYIGVTVGVQVQF